MKSTDITEIQNQMNVAGFSLGASARAWCWEISEFDLKAVSGMILVRFVGPRPALGKAAFI